MIFSKKIEKSYFFLQIFSKKFGSKKNLRTFAIPFGKYAEVAQLVEHNLAKVGVASSSLVFCSKNKKKVSRDADFTFERTSVLAISPDGVQSYASRPCAQGRLFCLISDGISVEVY